MVGHPYSQASRFDCSGVLGGSSWALWICLQTNLMGCGPRAAALPPGFPNLDGFVPVPADNYIRTGPKGPGRFVEFSPPTTSSAASPPPSTRSQQDRPRAFTAKAKYRRRIRSHTRRVLATGTVGDWGAAEFRIDKELSGCPMGAYNSGALLGAGQKLSYQNVTCAVCADGLVACVDNSIGQHGFALKPSGNRHVLSGSLAEWLPRLAWSGTLIRRP